MTREPAPSRTALAWRCRGRVIEIGDRALVMGVVNVTPDSFSDGGQFLEPAAVVATMGAGLVLMHMQGSPATMQQAPHYDDVAREVRDFLAARLALGVQAGVAPECVALDPGIGFGKTVEHNLRLIARLDELATLGRPIVLGASRKSFLGRVLADAATDQRLEGGIAAAAIAVLLGARVIRTHDVEATARAVRVAAAVARARTP